MPIPPGEIEEGDRVEHMGREGIVRHVYPSGVCWVDFVGGGGGVSAPCEEFKLIEKKRAPAPPPPGTEPPSMADREASESGEIGHYLSKMVRVLEGRAAEAGVSREAYLDGMIHGKYPQIHSREVDAFRDTDGEPA